MTRLRVAFQGEAGAYGEEAIRIRWNGEADPLPVRSFALAVAAVLQGAADTAVLPTWNTVVGEVEGAVRAIGAAGSRLSVAGELSVPVRHALMALSGATLASVRWVGSHPVALAQCSRFLAANPGIEPRNAYDTGGAARELHDLVDPWSRLRLQHEPRWYDEFEHTGPESLCVIAGAGAAAAHGLSVLLSDVQDHPDNTTRFAVISPRELVR